MQLNFLYNFVNYYPNYIMFGIKSIRNRLMLLLQKSDKKCESWYFQFLMTNPVLLFCSLTDLEHRRSPNWFSLPEIMTRMTPGQLEKIYCTSVRCVSGDATFDYLVRVGVRVPNCRVGIPNCMFRQTKESILHALQITNLGLRRIEVKTQR